MVNPGSFPGSRGDFLREQTELYAEAVKDNHVSDTLADIQRRFFKRYPVTLKDNEEPSLEWLAQVDDGAPDKELSPPDVEGMDEDAAKTALAEYSDQVARMKFKKDQIKRRLRYVYLTNQEAKSDFDKAAKDPIASITSKLLGMELKLPRRRTAYNVWGPKHRAEVDPVFQKRVDELGAKKEQHAAIRSAIYKELFESLPADAQNKWITIAEREHEKNVAEVKKRFKDSVSSSPEDRQRVIAALPKFIEPILDAVAEYTGWRASFIAGGPEPADGGRLNMISIHSGLTAGPIKMDFGHAQKATYKKHIAPAFGTFLKKCYTVQECKDSALPKNHSSISLCDIVSAEDVDMQVHTFESDAEHADMHKPKRLFEEIAKSGKSTKTKPPTGTPSPLVRFGPPIGKKKNRVLPFKDCALVKLGPSPLSQSFIASSSSNTSLDSPAGSPDLATGASKELPSTSAASEDGSIKPNVVGTSSISLTNAPGGVATVAPAPSTAVAETNNATAGLDVAGGSPTTVSTTTSAATTNAETGLDALTAASTTTLASAFVPFTTSAAAISNNGPPELDVGAGPTTTPTTVLNPVSLTSTTSGNDDDVARTFDAGAGPIATSTTVFNTPSFSSTTSENDENAMVEFDTEAGLTTTSTTALDTASLPSTIPKYSGSAAKEVDAGAGPATATPATALNAMSISDSDDSTGMEVDAGAGPIAMPATALDVAFFPSAISEKDDSAAMEFDVEAASTTTSTTTLDPTSLLFSISEGVDNGLMELDAGAGPATTPATALDATSASENYSDAAMELDAGAGPTTTPATVLDATSASENDNDAAMELEARVGSTASAPSAVPAATSHSAIEVDAIAGPTAASVTALDPASNSSAASSATSYAAAAPSAAAVPSLAPAHPAPFTTITSTASILQALGRASKARKVAVPFATMPSAAAMPLTSPLNTTGPPSAPPTVSHDAAVKEKDRVRRPTTHPAASVSVQRTTRGSTAAVRLNAPTSSPPSHLGSLPPSPQGSPLRPATLVTYSGAAAVPDQLDIDPMPAKGRKRKASLTGKENSAERASKRMRPASPGPSRKRRAESAAVDGPNKRPRTGSSYSFKVTVPSGWVASALTLLTSQDLGPQWHLLLEAWLVFEKGNGFSEKKKPWLSPAGRPEVISQWIKRHRSTTWRPDAGTCSSLESEFNSWWRSLQPSWRIEDGAELKRVSGEDWDVLRCSGVNGVLSVVAALFFWAHNGFDGAPTPVWDAAVADVLYAMEMLAKNT